MAATQTANTTVTLTDGTASSGKNFVDERLGIISGFVRHEQDHSSLDSVVLQTLNGSVFATTATDGQAGQV